VIHSLDLGKDLKSRETKITSVRRLIRFLQQPRFASLKKLVSPRSNELRFGVRKNTLAKIAQNCPLLEDMSLGCFQGKGSMRLCGCQLKALPILFPRLTKVSLGIDWRLKRNEVTTFVQTMGARLVHCHLFTDLQYGNSNLYLGNETLQAIGSHCPNLESFRYRFHDYMLADHESNITEDGVIALVHDCPKLKHLSLFYTKRVGLQAFDFIAANNNTGNLLELQVYGNDALMSSEAEATRARLGDKLNVFVARF
jgi:hypothetical protein